MRWLGTALVIGLATAAQADDFPGRFMVNDVASDDRLNIRSEPNAGADIVGSYPPYALNIEVLGTTPDGRWGEVGFGEGNGWVAMRYLARTPDESADEVPRPLICAGTEPFWSLGLFPRGDSFERAGEPREPLSEISSARGENGFVISFSGETAGTSTLVVQRATCSDGMSDRIFGWAALLYKAGQETDTVFSGCCTFEGN